MGLWSGSVVAHSQFVGQIQKHLDKCSPILVEIRSLDDLPLSEAIRKIRLDLATCNGSLIHLKEMLTLEIAIYNEIVSRFGTTSSSSHTADCNSLSQNHTTAMGFYGQLATLTIRKEQFEAELQHYLAKQEAEDQKKETKGEHGG